MKTDDPLHGDSLGFISVYGCCHALFVRLKNILNSRPSVRSRYRNASTGPVEAKGYWSAVFGRERDAWKKPWLTWNVTQHQRLLRRNK